MIPSLFLREGLSSVSQLCFFVTPWTVAHWALLSMEFSRQEYWSELPFPSLEGNNLKYIYIHTHTHTHTHMHPPHTHTHTYITHTHYTHIEKNQEGDNSKTSKWLFLKMVGYYR